MPRDMDEERGYGMFWVRVFFRIMMGAIALAILVTVVLDIVYGPSHPVFFLSWGWGLVGLFFFLWFLSWVFRPWPHRHHRGRCQWEDETTILRKRYARGEITKPQFKSMLKDLKDSEE